MSTPTAQRLESVKEYYLSKKLREVAALIKAGNPILNMSVVCIALNDPHVRSFI